MASEKEKVAVNVLVDHFGDIVAKTVTCLLAKGPRSMRDLCSETKLKANEVRKGLLVALQHNLVTVSERKSPSGCSSIYTADLKQVLQRQHIPQLVRFARCAASSQPLISQRVMEDLLLNGCLCLSAVLKNSESYVSSTPSTGNSYSQATTMEVFTALTRAHIVCRTDGDPEDRFSVPAIDLESSDTVVPAGRKRQHSPDRDAPAAKRTEGSTDASHTTSEGASSSNYPDADCLWKANFERLHQYLRNEAITAMTVDSFDAAAGSVVSTLLRLAELKPETNHRTEPISSFELFQALPSTPLLSRAELSLYLKLLSDGTTSFVQKVGDNAGGVYSVDLSKCLDRLVEDSIVSVVQERFGSKSLRIFRLLLDKHHLEEKQIGDMAMIPAKEAKELLYRMLKAHFITFQEIPRTPDHAPSRTFYLFSVNRQHVAKTCLQLSYQSLLHLQQKRLSLEKESRRLLERQQQFDLQKAKILASSSESKDEDVALLEEDLLPPADKAMIKKLHSAFARLDEGESMLASSILRLSKFECV